MLVTNRLLMEILLHSGFGFGKMPYGFMFYSFYYSIKMITFTSYDSSKEITNFFIISQEDMADNSILYTVLVLYGVTLTAVRENVNGSFTMPDSDSNSDSYSEGFPFGYNCYMLNVHIARSRVGSLSPMAVLGIRVRVRIRVRQCKRAIIIADDMRLEAEPYRNHWGFSVAPDELHTPNLEGLAKNGTTFHRAYRKVSLFFEMFKNLEYSAQEKKVDNVTVYFSKTQGKLCNQNFMGSCFLKGNHRGFRLNLSLCQSDV